MEMKEHVTQALKDAVTETFSNTLTLTAAVKDVSADNLANVVRGKSLVATIGLTGKMDGMLVVVFSEEAAKKIVAKMLGTAPEDLTQDVFDGVGELTNILAGGVTRRCAGEGERYDLSIPSVVCVDNPLKIVRWGRSEAIQVVIECGELKLAACVSYVFDKKFDAVEKQMQSQEKQEIAEKYLKDLIQ